MAQTQRTVQHLRVQAAQAQHVRQWLPRLDDALRCASLPDADARVLLVRRLALGRVQRDWPAQTLARHIEQRVAAAGWTFVPGGSPQAQQAQAVWFDDALQARVKLAQALHRGEPVDAWYWPLAVPEFEAGRSVADNLRRMAAVVRSWPQAAVSEPLWRQALAEAGAPASHVAMPVGSDAPGRATALDPGRPDAVAAAPGPTPPRPAIGATPRDRAPAGAVRRPRAAAHAGAPPTSQADATARAGQWHRRPVAAQAAAAAPAVEGLPAVALRAPAMPATRPQAQAAATPSHRLPQGVPAAPPDAPASDPGVLAGPPGQTAPPAVPPAGRPDPALRRDAGAALAAVTGFDLPWTDAGGLLYLLPVLRHLGLPDWLADLAPVLQRRWVWGLLATALRAAPWPSPAPQGDALRALCAEQAGGTAPAWSRHEAPLPAPLAGLLPAGARQAGFARALQQAPDGAAQARLWLLAVRRWLRRRAGLGLAEVLVRPARLHATRTHLDLHFRLNDIDLRLRRAGLDQDPGWLPWFGQVVSFHFDATTPADGGHA